MEPPPATPRRRSGRRPSITSASTTVRRGSEKVRRGSEILLGRRSLRRGSSTMSNLGLGEGDELPEGGVVLAEPGWDAEQGFLDPSSRPDGDAHEGERGCPCCSSCDGYIVVGNAPQA